MVKTSIVVLLAAGTALGVLGLAWVLRERRPVGDSGRIGPRSAFNAHASRPSGVFPLWVTQGAVPLVVGLLCVILTRWPVAGVLGALAAATLPGSLRRIVPGAQSRRTEAVASWTELIRDSLAASAGLAQAIVVTAPSAPTAIRPHVGALASRLTSGVSLESALRSFAVEVDDPAAEFLVCALLLAATAHGQRLVDVLTALAASMRDDVSMHLRVDASRASARSSVRTVVLFSVGFACALALVAHSYLSPFGSAVGQLVLAIVGVCYGVGLALMVRMVRPIPQSRLLEIEGVG